MNKKAFTLIELLVTSSILVSLIVLTSSIFASVGRLQVGRKGGESLSVAARQIQARLDEDLLRADQRINITDYPVEIRSVTKTNSNGEKQKEDLIALRVQVQDGNGTSTGATEWHVYCNEETSRRLTRFRFTSIAVPGVFVNTYACTTGDIFAFMGGVGGSQIGSQYLTDDTTVVSNLKFIQEKPVVASSIYDDASKLFATPVIRYEMRLKPTDATLGVSPLLVTGTVTRTSKFGEILP